MAHVQGEEIEAKMQGRSADEKVSESNRNTFGSLLALNSSRELRNLKGQRISNQVVEGSFREDTSADAVRIVFGAMHAVSQLHDTDG